MATRLRLASFNVENLFSRAKILNFDNEKAKPRLETVEKLRKELSRKTYDEAEIIKLYNEVKDYIEIVEVRGKLFDKSKKHLRAKGVDEWGGFIDFKRAKFSESARANTARVLRTVNADVCCLVEVESRPVVEHFCIEHLPRKGSFNRYDHIMLIDGNDNRGIDVALASRLPYNLIRSHIDDVGEDKKKIFSRDCLEIEVVHPAGFSIWMLLNHFKSQGYGSPPANNAKRKRQAERVAEILKDYDLKKDFVVVCGDFNDHPESDPLQPLLKFDGLTDVLALEFGDPKDRWTYHYKKNEQIDYILISDALKRRFKGAGIERRGLFGVEKFTKGQTLPFDTVTKDTDSASDHCAVFADFEF
jgi:endonuclease/exonuclease/phosphatase family metal-dependent hydrolase